MFASAAAAATREPLGQALAQARSRPTAFASSVSPNPAALRAMVRDSARRFAAAADEFEISSSHYGSAEVASVANTLRSLDHGPEMASLSVYVATPEEIRELCGTTVVACYLPAEREMIVSGIDRPVAGVPRAFAIAHEYGHHVANSRQGGAFPAIDAGTIRWATYERVCQLTRSGRLFPGDQGAHYWEDPEEAFAQSYAHLNDLAARVSWQYTPLLQPTATSLAKIHADVVRPWSGPVSFSWSGAVTGPPAVSPSAPSSGRSGPLAVGPARVAGTPPWVDARLIRTPLDGAVTVSLHAPAGAPLDVALRDSGSGHVLSSAATDSAGDVTLAYSNCGHADLRLEIRGAAMATAFQATITRP